MTHIYQVEMPVPGSSMLNTTYQSANQKDLKTRKKNEERVGKKVEKLLKLEQATGVKEIKKEEMKRAKSEKEENDRLQKKARNGAKMPVLINVKQGKDFNAANIAKQPHYSTLRHGARDGTLKSTNVKDLPPEPSNPPVETPPCVPEKVSQGRDECIADDTIKSPKHKKPHKISRSTAIRERAEPTIADWQTIARGDQKADDQYHDEKTKSDATGKKRRKIEKISRSTAIRERPEPTIAESERTDVERETQQTRTMRNRHVAAVPYESDISEDRTAIDRSKLREPTTEQRTIDRSKLREPTTEQRRSTDTAMQETEYCKIPVTAKSQQSKKSEHAEGARLVISRRRQVFETSASSSSEDSIAAECWCVKTTNDEAAWSQVPKSYDAFTAVSTNGDDNCLFGAVSHFITGRQDQTTIDKLRRLTADELEHHANVYSRHSILARHADNMGGLAVLVRLLAGADLSNIDSEDPDEYVRAEGAATRSETKWSSMLQVMALSTVVGHPIQTVIPVNKTYYSSRIHQSNLRVKPRSLSRADKLYSRRLRHPIVVFWATEGSAHDMQGIANNQHRAVLLVKKCPTKP